MKSLLVLTLLTVIAATPTWAGREERVGGFPRAEQVASVKATLSGIAEGEVYHDLPPVLVEFEGLPPRAAVWVEACHGRAESGERGVTVDARLVPNEGRLRVLSVHGLNESCAKEGSWTLLVKMSDANGIRLLARRTFARRAGR
jgi:hypothetical protein